MIIEFDEEASEKILDSTISKSGSTVTIDCANADDAQEIFDVIEAFKLIRKSPIQIPGWLRFICFTIFIVLSLYGIAAAVYLFIPK